MGICYWDARILWEARLRGVSFDNTLTVGHQSLYLHPKELQFFEREFHSHFPDVAAETLENYKFGDFSDAFLTSFLGVNNCSILDISSYQGAGIVHDLNLPVSETLHGQFDSIIDSGSLEHIFNFPVAISNLMRMLKVGGSIFITTPANNLCGHGFYQFSPELMFRVFSGENGFELSRAVMFEGKYPSVELTSSKRAYNVIDPEKVKSRVGLLSSYPATLAIEARKIAKVPLFATPPLQSDYVTLWEEADVAKKQTSIKAKLRDIFEQLPFSIQTMVDGYRQKKKFSFSNREFYKRLK